MGETLRRLAAKCMVVSSSFKAANLLAPLQLGVGVRGGCEAIVHGVRAVLESDEVEIDEKWLLQLDLVNAFNLADRNSVFKEVREHFPELARWVESSYGFEAYLVFGSKVVDSTTGMHQGDPLAGLLFAINFHPVALKVKDQVPDLRLHKWLFDDGSMIGKQTLLLKALSIIVEEGTSRGLVVSTVETVRVGEKPKTTMWHHSINLLQELEVSEVTAVDNEGVVLLGAPIGTENFQRLKIQQQIEK